MDYKDKGLLNKYLIKKVRYEDRKVAIGTKYEKIAPVQIIEDVDEDAEYFVLRLDYGGNDKKHIDACRLAVLKYADEIKDHLPLLSKDLIEKFLNREEK